MTSTTPDANEYTCSDPASRHIGVVVGHHPTTPHTVFEPVCSSADVRLGVRSLTCGESSQTTDYNRIVSYFYRQYALASSYRQTLQRYYDYPARLVCCGPRVGRITRPLSGQKGGSSRSGWPALSLSIRRRLEVVGGGVCVCTRARVLLDCG